MRILFDQGTHVPLRRWLMHHEVTTAYERNWSGLKNGELLNAAENQGFAAFASLGFVLDVMASWYPESAL